MKRTNSGLTLLALLLLGLGVAPSAWAQEAEAPPAGTTAAEGGEGASSEAGTPAAAEGEAAAEGSSPAAPAPSEEAFELKVKSLEEKVTDLKEKIYRTKARLLLLQETVIGGDLTSGAKAVLVHRNEMGSSFVLESVAYALDGAPIFTRVDPTGELDEQEEIEIFNGRIVPGNHQIGVRMVFRGNGYGIFSYLNDYKFTVQSQYTFNAEGGKVTEVRIVAFEKGGITTDLKDRPAVRYDVEVTRDRPKRQAGAGAAGGGG